MDDVWHVSSDFSGGNFAKKSKDFKRQNDSLAE